MNEKVTAYDAKMTKTINNLDSELVTIRAGRANPHVLDKLYVDYYGAPTPIQQVANVSVPEARMIRSSRGRRACSKRSRKRSSHLISASIRPMTVHPSALYSRSLLRSAGKSLPKK